MRRKKKDFILNEKEVYATPWFTLTAMEVSGLKDPYYVLTPMDYVAITAITNEGEILLVRQFRPAAGGYTLEFPAGTVEPGESPSQAAERELLEETGYTCTVVEETGCLRPDTGRLGNRLWCFYAKGLRKTSHASDSSIDVVKFPVSKINRLIRSGKFDHALHIAAWLLAEQKADRKIPVSK